ncbi:glycoside hydrolase family 3 N-terminal domain-containing protein [Sulfurimonas sp.]|uniref:glycoside hydrolase family 3 N-terminal domain-containing protein n=1 Tax=Sulfurimonas sp. TaxID=2022749 RepID=UPI0026173D75|nr:glycoside hydrolase family 3 N-terminal domain-containing protein [Sulfurimonas sp.]
MKIFLLFLSLFLSLNAATLSDTQLKKMIGRMLILGFSAKEINASSQIAKDIQKYDLGGVILFDREFKDRNKTKNIASQTQLQKLTKDLQTYSKKPLFIAVDQEGGRVARLKPQYGFVKIPSAAKVATQNLNAVHEIYQTQSQMLHKNGINLNFAPVVDLAINPKNSVIVGLERSYGKNPQKVATYAAVMIEEQNKEHIISVLKHFPGHGSSLGDSHKGFVDVTNTWTQKELEPDLTHFSISATPDTKFD